MSLNLSNLHDVRVLVVEDEYMLADETRLELEGAGATVLGPVASIAAAERFLAAGSPPTIAVLDVNLQGEMVFPLAARLRAIGVPVVFATGYDADTIPGAFSDTIVLVKPVSASALVKAVADHSRESRVH